MWKNLIPDPFSSDLDPLVHGSIFHSHVVEIRDLCRVEMAKTTSTMDHLEEEWGKLTTGQPIPTPGHEPPPQVRPYDQGLLTIGFPS